MFVQSYEECDLSVRFDTDDDPLVFFNKENERRPVTRITVGLGEDLGVASAHPPAGFDRFQDDEGLKRVSKKVRTWMMTCRDEHHCREANKVLPSRLLSIASPIVKLHESQWWERDSYAALSHCWGRRPILRTTLTTRKAHKKGIKWDSLGKTFQDAITLARSLGLKYIWIDSLCIIQDSVTDWEIESARMAGAYQNAEITIAASSAVDGSVGLFGDQSETPYIWRRGGYNIELSANQQTSDSGGYQSSYITVRHPDQWRPFPIYIGPNKAFWMCLEPTHEVLEHHRRRSPADIVGLGMPLFTRAWFLQERLMSPRVIHFGAMEMYWECDHGMVCECLERDKEKLHSIATIQQATARGLYSGLVRQSTSQAHGSIRSFVTTTKKKNVQKTEIELEAWHKMIEEYSRLLLTRESDQLPALSGIANTLSTTYLAGVWAEHVPWCFFWTPDTTCNVLIRRPFTYRAPSFSWASIEGPINYYAWFPSFDPNASNEIGHVVASVIDKSSTAEGLDPGGRVTDGYITLFGHSGVATVTKIYMDGTTTRCELHHSNMFQSFKLDVSLSLARAEPTEVLPGDEVLLFLLECKKMTGQWYINSYGTYRLSALVLVRQGTQNPTYKRIGLIGPVDEIELGTGVDGTMCRTPDSLSIAAPGWFDQKREVRIV